MSRSVPQVEEQEAEDFDVVGQSRTRVDAWEKVTGEVEYADDIDRSRLAHGKLKRATKAHAEITTLDTSRAEAMDGVHAVITGEDVPVVFGIMPAAEDETALAQDKVRYVGEPVAAVAAADEATAERACEAIEVEYEEYDPVTTYDQAFEDTDEPIHAEHGGEGNVDRLGSLEFGDVDAGLEEAAHVREDVFFYEGNTHLPLEQHSAVASWDPGLEKLTLWASTQVPHYVHRQVAKALELPERRVRIHANSVGGGFGGKTDPFPHQICAGKLSMKTNRPVKITLTREEVFYAHRGRHPVLMWVKTGVDEDGSITAMDWKSFLDGGAYGSYGPATTYYTGALQTVTYRIPNYRFRGTRVNTNKPPCGPKRGHGTPQPRYALELHLQRLAEDLGMDQIELRRRNFTGEHELTANWLEVTTNGVEECTDRVLAASDWDEKRGQLPEGKGVGFAVGSYITGAGLPIYWNDMPHSEVQIKVDRSGSVTAFCGEAEVGQGSDTMLASIVAEVFGLEPEDVSLEVGDTDTSPVDLGSYSSRVTLMMGNAAVEAAEKALTPILEAVAAELDVPVERLVAREGRVYDREDPETGVAFPDAVKIAEAEYGLIGAVGSYTPPDHHGEYEGAGVGPTPAYSYSAAVAQVDVDTETGQLDVEQVWLAHDVGRAINPNLVEGQVEGSVYMGLGEVLMEKWDFSKTGQHYGPSMLDYKSPTAGEMPAVDSIIVETVDQRGPFGAKEAGQGPLLPVPPAVTDAVKDAVGVEISETPITPRKVLAAMQGRDVGPDGLPDFEFPEPEHVEVPENVGEW
ncbi:MAG: xanthine dehydrogenase family protein molybdopterin-binding subunit [Halobacteriales archaeon]